MDQCVNQEPGVKIPSLMAHPVEGKGHGGEPERRVVLGETLTVAPLCSHADTARLPDARRPPPVALAFQSRGQMELLIGVKPINHEIGQMILRVPPR